MFKVPPEGHRASRKLISPRARSTSCSWDSESNRMSSTSRIGCLLQPEDLGAGAPRPLERLAYADLLRCDWGLLRDTYDLHGPPRTPAYHVGWG